MTAPGRPAHAAPDQGVAEQGYGLALRRLLPLLFGCYIAAYLDRVNVGFAKLQMAQSLAWSDAVFGFGAGIFFLGYFLFEVPSNLLLERVGARRWIARIMISWGVVSAAFALVDRLPWGPVPGWFGLEPAVFGFYLLRFLLGVAEAGFFPGMILYLTYWFPGARRTRVVALCMTAIAVANVVGAPLSGAIMQGLDGAAGWAGWRWLFVLEAAPSVLMGVVVLRLLPDGPAHAAWLSPAQRAAITAALAADHPPAGEGAPHRALDALRSGRVWALALVYLSSTLSLYGINFWMPTLIQELGIAPTDYVTVGLLSMIPWGTAGVVMVWVGSHSDRTGERRWHVAGSLFAIAAGLLLLIAAGRTVAPSLLALSLVASGVLAFVATFWSIPTAFLRASAAAAGIAWINSVGNLGGHFGPDLIGRIRTATGSATGAFLFLAAMALLGAALTLWVTRDSMPARGASRG
jgi:sugar phosphate permease